MPVACGGPPLEFLISSGETNASERVNEWLAQHGDKRLYSFRHTFKTMMRAAMMPIDERIFYQGHSCADVAATYGSNLTITLSAYIERIPTPRGDE